MTKLRQFALGILTAVLAVCLGFAVNFAVSKTAGADYVEIKDENVSTYLDVREGTLYGFRTDATIPNKVSIVIPENVTAIAPEAFDARREIVSVTLNTVLTADGIGANAFRNCNSLVEVYDRTTAHITDGLGTTTTSLGRLVYSALNVYSDTNGKSELTKTDDGFIFCSDTRHDGNNNYLVGYVGNASTVTLPETYLGKAYEIYQYAFWRVRGVEEITIPEGVTALGDYSFFECYDLESVVLPTTLKTIGNFAFQNNSTDVSAIASITYRGAEAQTGNPVLLPEGLVSIGAYAFSGLGHIDSITIPASVREIGAYAFEDCTKLADTATVEFVDADLEYDADGDPTNGLVINRYAFFNCDRLRVVTLPQRLTEMYRRVFAGCSRLTFAYMPDSVTYYAVDVSEASFFDVNTTLVFDSRESYNNALNKPYISNHARSMTYLVNVEFSEIVEKAGSPSTVTPVTSVKRLYGRAYNYVQSAELTWATVDSTVFPVQDGYSASVWYLDEGWTTQATFANVANLLKNTDGDKIELYAHKLEKPEVEAKSLVYDAEKTYLASNWNEFIVSSFGDSEMNAYYGIKIDGKPDGSIHNAGDYAVSVGIKDEASFGVWAQDVSTTVTVDKQPFNIANLRWTLTGGGNNAGYADNTRLYIYTYNESEDGQTYPSLTRLTAERAAQLKLTYSRTVVVTNSIVRHTGKEITIKLDLAGFEDEFEVVYTNATKTRIDTHQSTATVKAIGNYVLVQGSTSPASSLGLTIALADDVCTITKTWYIMSVENKLYADSSKTDEFTVAGWTYTDTTGIPTLPVLEHSAVAGQQMYFSLVSDVFSTALTFEEADFGKYINASMPAGNYTLTISVPEAVDDSPAYNISFPFTVSKAKLSQTVLNELSTKLTGKTFEHRYDGNIKLYNADLSFINNVPNPARTGYWADQSNLYSTEFTLSYNLYRMLSNNYYASSELGSAPASPIRPDTYTVYYQIEAKNFEPLVNVMDDSGRRSYYFTTSIYEAVFVPDLDRTPLYYTGYEVYPTIANGRGYYLETIENADYINHGAKQVKLVLEDPDHAKWYLDNDTPATATNGVYTATYTINRAQNGGDGLNLIRWAYGSYDPTINIATYNTKFTDYEDSEFITYTLTSETTKTIYYSHPKGNQLGFDKAPAGTYTFIPYVKGYEEGVAGSEKYNWNNFMEMTGIKIQITAAENRWIETPNIIRWSYGEFDPKVNLITATPRLLDENKSVKFTVQAENGASLDPRLNSFTLMSNGLVDTNVTNALSTLPAGAYRLIAVVEGTSNYAGLNTGAAGETPLVFNIMTATNYWQQTPNIIRWQYGQFDKTVNTITAVPTYGTVEYRILTRNAEGKYTPLYYGDDHEAVGVGTTAKSAFIVDSNGVVPDDVAARLSQLSAGTYYLLATVYSSQLTEGNNNYTGLNNVDESTTPIPFNIQKATNTWKSAPNIIRWTYGNYNAQENTITAQASFGTATFKITDSSGKEWDVKDLGKLSVGVYTLTATVAETDDYTGLNSEVTFQIFEPTDTSFLGTQIASAVVSGLTILALVALVVVMLIPKKGGKK